MPDNNNNDIEALRSHLFDTLRSLKGEVKPAEIERAKAVCDVAGKIIDTARVEVSFLKTTQNASGSEFFNATRPALPEAPATPMPALPAGKVNGHANGKAARG